MRRLIALHSWCWQPGGGALQRKQPQAGEKEAAGPQCVGCSCGALPPPWEVEASGCGRGNAFVNCSAAPIARCEARARTHAHARSTRSLDVICGSKWSTARATVPAQAPPRPKRDSGGLRQPVDARRAGGGRPAAARDGERGRGAGRSYRAAAPVQESCSAIQTVGAGPPASPHRPPSAPAPRVAGNKAPSAPGSAVILIIKGSVHTLFEPVAME
jgi:hypothetical protein